MHFDGLGRTKDDIIMYEIADVFKAKNLIDVSTVVTDLLFKNTEYDFLFPAFGYSFQIRGNFVKFYDDYDLVIWKLNLNMKYRQVLYFLMYSAQRCCETAKGTLRYFFSFSLPM